MYVPVFRKTEIRSTIRFTIYDKNRNRVDFEETIFISTDLHLNML